MLEIQIFGAYTLG